MELNVFRVIGAAVIVIGLYLIIWGKSKDSSLTDSRNSDIEIVDQETILEKDPEGNSKLDIVDGVIKEDRDVEASV